MKALRLLLLAAILLAVSACSVEFPTPTPTAAVIPFAAGRGGATSTDATPSRTLPAATATPRAMTVPVTTPSPTFVLRAPLPTLAPSPTLTPAATTAAAPAGPAPAPLGGRIVLQTAIGGPIMTMNSDGSRAATLTAGIDPAWSPDGKQIVFTRWSEPQGLYVMNADGSELRLVFGINGARSPVWSPDGTKIAFTTVYKQVTRPGRPGGPASSTDYRRISVVDLAGGQKTDVMLDGDQQANTPSWGADGRFVYKGVRGLFLTTETGWPSALTADPLQQSPAWSPDGAMIVYMVDQHDHWDIGLVNSDGSGERLLTSSPPVLGAKPTNNVAPAWSPDGRSIAFLSDRGGDWKLYVMNADGSNQRKLLDVVVAYEYAAERVLSWTK